MQRTNLMKEETPDAILTADWHLRETQPVCRLDDFWEAQWKAVGFVSTLQKKYDCDVWHGGDLFHHWKPSPNLLSVTIKNLPKKFRSIYGNHDLPQHSMELVEKSGMYNLYVAGVLAILKGGHCDTILEEVSFEIKGRKVAVWHIMNYQGKEPWPGCTSPKASTLLRKYPQFDLILTGDNHQSFVEEHEGKLLVNPGSLTRQSAKQIDFQPSIYLYYARTNTVKQVFIPIEGEVISREHIEEIEKRDARIDAFISTLDKDWKIGFDFKENLKVFEQTNTVKKSIMDIIYNAIES